MNTNNSDETPAGWRPVLGDPVDGNLRNLLIGLLFRRWIIIGILAQKNYPATDPLWPGRMAEFCIVIFDRAYGIWNDPGY